jgi:hypothetical protein
MERLLIPIEKIKLIFHIKIERYKIKRQRVHFRICIAVYSGAYSFAVYELKTSYFRLIS